MGLFAIRCKDSISDPCVGYLTTLGSKGHFGLLPCRPNKSILVLSSLGFQSMGLQTAGGGVATLCLDVTASDSELGLI